MQLRSLRLLLVCSGCARSAAASSPSDCAPQPPAIETPANITELHPGHVSIVMTMGDSMSAGFAAGAGPDIFHAGLLQENRGVAFNAGVGSAAHRTLPYYLRQYSPNLIGASHGVHPIEVPKGSNLFGGLYEGYTHPEMDQFNAALSEAQSFNLPEQVTHLQELGKKIDGFGEKWKVLTIMIGANDLSHPSACTDNKTSENIAAYFKQKMDEVMGSVVRAFDRVYINLVGAPSLHSLAKLVHNSVRCKLVFPVQKEEVDCIVEDSPVKWALLGYTEGLVDAALRSLADKYNHFTPNHAVVYHGLMHDTPLPSLKWVSWDCTHPSSLAHNAGGTLLWNSMLATADERKAIRLVPDPVPTCPAPQSAFQSGPLGAAELVLV